MDVTGITAAKALAIQNASIVSWLHRRRNGSPDPSQRCRSQH